MVLELPILPSYVFFFFFFQGMLPSLDKQPLFSILVGTNVF